MSELFVAFLCGLFGGSIASVVHKWTLVQKSIQLEIAVTDLQERLLVEMKKRASLAARDSKKFDEDVLVAAKNAPVTAAPPLPWWAQYVGKNNSS